MSVRRLPVRPSLEQLKHQAKDLLRDAHAGDAAAVAEFAEHHPDRIDPAQAKLADAQLVLARSYQTTSWARLAQAAQLAESIWNDDLEEVRELVTRNPTLIKERVLIRADSHWGPPMTYAANLGRDAIIKLLYSLGATDLESAAQRAALQSKVETAKMLYDRAGRPQLTASALDGTSYTLSVPGTALLLTLGTPIQDGTESAPIATALQTDGRNPAAKHEILELFVKYGADLPDTPTMAVHRGRIDLLERHLGQDPELVRRRFSHREIFPPELGCRAEIDASIGTALDGTTLLHMCVEYDEMEIARWLIVHGADVNARATVGRNGFGGHTPLFSAVVSEPNFWMNYHERGPFTAPFATLLLENGADPNARASIWKRFNAGHDDTMTRHDYRDVTPLSYGRRFHSRIFVSEPALALIEAAGGFE